MEENYSCFSRAVYRNIKKNDKIYHLGQHIHTNSKFIKKQDKILNLPRGIKKYNNRSIKMILKA